MEANAAECAALAERMDLPAVLALTCRSIWTGMRPARCWRGATWWLALMQTCVVSLDDFVSDVEERFAVRCVPEGEETDDADPEALDEITYADGYLDLGEAAAEQLALALDPYPRAPGRGVAGHPGRS